MKKILVLFLPLVLLGQIDISISDDLASILGKNKFLTASINYNGTVFQYKYLPIDSDINYAKAEKIKRFGQQDILTHLWNLIVFHNNHELSKLQPLGMSDDLIQSVDQDWFNSFWKSESIDTWYFTDVIIYQDNLFFRSLRKDQGRESIIDVWAFSFEDGTWKFNLISERFSKFSRFQEFIFRDILPLSPGAKDSFYGDLALGDTLHIYLAQHPVKFTYGDQELSSWLEGRKVKFLSYEKDGKPAPPYILLSSNDVPFGVLEGKSPDAYYLFDTDGDGTLDFKAESPLIPIYLVEWSSTNKEKASNELKSMLDILYDSYNSNEGFSMNDQTKSIWDIFVEAGNRYDYANRDLIYMLNYYFLFVDTPEQALVAINTLDQEYTDRYGESHPIIKLFCLESNSQSNNKYLATEYSHELSAMAPEFLPGKYYQYIYETDRKVAAKYLNELRTNKDHWLLKTLF